MLPALLIILSCQLIGEVLTRTSQLPLPGPVIGMVLLLGALHLSERIRSLVRPVAENILSYLLLLFVPAGVGAVLQLPSLGKDAWGVALAILVSTLLAIVAAALTFLLAAKLTRTGHDEQDLRK